MLTQWHPLIHCCFSTRYQSCESWFPCAVLVCPRSLWRRDIIQRRHEYVSLQSVGFWLYVLYQRCHRNLFFFIFKKYWSNINAFVLVLTHSLSLTNTLHHYIITIVVIIIATFSNALSCQMGGGYGGADFNPYTKSETEIQRFCQR